MIPSLGTLTAAQRGAASAREGVNSPHTPARRIDSRHRAGNHTDVMRKVMMVAAALVAFTLASWPAAATEEQRAWALAAEYPKVRPYVADALKGNSKAMKTLGILFEVLVGNHEDAAHWYRLSALRRNARAQLLIANSYRHGRGVPKSTALAFAWYMTASVECEQATLSKESSKGPTPSEEEWETARHMSLLIRMLTAQFASKADCSEYFDTGTTR